MLLKSIPTSFEAIDIKNSFLVDLNFSATESKFNIHLKPVDSFFASSSQCR
jgi:hypothetical protein